MRNVIENVAMTIATFSFLCTLAFVVGAYTDKAPVQGQYASIFIDVPDTVTTVELTDRITSGHDEGAVLVRDNVRDLQADSYLYLGAQPPQEDPKPFLPVDRPSFTPVEPTSAVDLGGQWGLFSSQDPATVISSLQNEGIHVTSDTGGLDLWKSLLSALWKAMLIQSGALLFVLFIAVYLYLGSARARTIQRLTVLGWARKDVIREILRRILTPSAMTIGGAFVVLLIAWGLYNQWSSPGLVLSIVLGGSLGALALQTLLVILGALMVTWLPSREESERAATTSVRTYRAAVVAQCMLLAVGIVAVGQLPNSVVTMRGLGHWEKTWKSAQNIYSVSLSSAILSQSSDKQEEDYRALAEMLGSLPTRAH